MDDIRLEEYRIIHILSELAFLDRFGILLRRNGNRTFLTPEQFKENNRMRIQEMLTSPYYRELKAIDRTVAESSEEEDEPLPSRRPDNRLNQPGSSEH